MFGLSTTTTAIIVTAVLVVVALAYLLFGWVRKHSWRVMFRGVGIIVLLAGMLTIGILTKFVGIEAFINWTKTTVMNNWIMVGLIVFGVGLLIFVVGSFWPMVLGDEASTRREARKARRLAALQSAPASPKPAPAPFQPAGAAPDPAATPAASPMLPPATADDKEIDDILKSHGIN